MSNTKDMNNPPLHKEESKSGVGDDLRAAPFTDQVFDDDYYGRASRSGRGRSYGFLLGLLVGTAVAVTFGYLAFNSPSKPTTVSGEPSVIRAESTPYKIKPADPGGMQVANQDKLVYDRVAKGKAPQQVENLLPPVEEPQKPPPKPAEITPNSTITILKEQPAMEKKEEDGLTEVQPPEIDPLETAMEEITSEITKTPATSSEITETKPQTADTNWSDGVYLVQLAAVMSKEAAEGEWKRLVDEHQGLLGSLRHVVLEADLGDRGIFYRLRVGPLGDRSEADELCGTLTAQNVPCITITP